MKSCGNKIFQLFLVKHIVHKVGEPVIFQMVFEASHACPNFLKLLTTKLRSLHTE